MGLTCLSVFREAPERAVNDVSIAHIWGISSVQALKMVMLKYRRTGAKVDVVRLNAASEMIVNRLGIHAACSKARNRIASTTSPSITGPTDWFTGRVRITVRVRGIRPRHRRPCHLRGKRAHGMAQASRWPDPNRHL